MVTPLLYGAAVDLVNGDSGFAMSALMFLVGGYALARLGQQVFSEAKQYLFAKVAQRAVREQRVVPPWQKDIVWPR